MTNLYGRSVPRLVRHYHKMQLQELPVEIISTICRYTGLEYYWDPKVSTRFNNVDFHSLRYTCKVCDFARITVLGFTA
jgi:hypothetical protein